MFTWITRRAHAPERTYFKWNMFIPFNNSWQIPPKHCRRWKKTISFNLYRLPREKKYMISKESRWLQTNDSQELLIVFVSITENLSYFTKIWNWILFKYNNILFICRNWRDQCWVEKFFFVVEQTGISLVEVNHQRMVSFYYGRL